MTATTTSTPPATEPDDRLPAATVSVAVVANSDVLGGAELYLSGLYGGLRDAVAATLVGRLPGWSLPAVDAGVGAKWSRRNLVRSLRAAPRERRSMIDAVRGTGAQWSHLQYKREQILLSSALARTSRVLWTEHGTLYAGRGARVLRLAYRRAARHVDTIVCVSDEVAASVRAVVGAGPRVLIVDNPVDGERFRPADAPERARLRTRLLPPGWQNRRVAVVACRLHPAKRLHRVLELCAAAGIPLLVVGDGPDRSRLEALASASGGQVHFLGHRSDPGEVAEILRACDDYVFSATVDGEGQPLAILEAAASGLRVIGFSGDTGNGLITALGGSVLDCPAATFPTADARAGAVGREYVLRSHAPDAWRAAYARVLR